MAYKTADLLKKSLVAIEKNKLFFIEDVVSFLPCSKQTFYDHHLDEVDALKEALQKNRIEVKVSLRSRWYKSDAPALQMGLYKLIGTEEEADRLSGTKQKIEHSGEIKTITETTEFSLKRKGK